MNLIEQIADHMEFCGLGVCATLEHEGDLYWGQMPESPDAAVCVFSTDTAYPGSTSGARIQIMCRGAVGDARTPYERACAITDELGDFLGFLSGDGPYARIEVTNSAQGVGLDTRGRHIYVSNYRVYYCDY